MFTSIHRTLGIAPGALTWHMVEQLIDQQVEEAADLDFKKELPIGKGSWREEAAKDFAAMANSGGGVVLYGVAEERGQGTAKSIEHFEVKEHDVRALTLVAYNQVHPPLMDVRPVKILDPDRPGLGVLAMVVAPSTDVPHIYWKQDSFLAPVRHGSDTRWMDERQIEQAYSERFDGRRRRRADLSNFYDETLAHVGQSRRACVVAVAIPPAGGGSPDGFPTEGTGAMDTYYAALRRVDDFVRADHTIFRDFSLSPMIGLRRWRWLDRAANGASNHLLEFHKDGSIALVFDVDGQFLDATSEAGRAAAEEWRPRTTSMAVEFSMGVLGSFLSAVAEQMGHDRGYEVRAGVTWEADTADRLPLEMYMSYDRWHHVSRPERIRRFTPVDAYLRTGTLGELKTDIHLLCTDVLNQAGVNSILYLRDV